RCPTACARRWAGSPPFPARTPPPAAGGPRRRGASGVSWKGNTTMGDRMRPQPPVRTPPSLDGFDAPRNPPHAQFLATEHWSLLATRSMTWNEISSRTGTYLTVLSATVIALSLVANATATFGPGFRTFALLRLPVVLLAWWGTDHGL